MAAEGVLWKVAPPLYAAWILEMRLFNEDFFFVCMLFIIFLFFFIFICLLIIIYLRGGGECYL